MLSVNRNRRAVSEGPRKHNKNMRMNCDSEESLLSEFSYRPESPLPIADENVSQDPTVLQLLTHIPDQVIDFDQTIEMPANEHFIGVTLFADISGFTSLTEKYSNMEINDGTSGTDRLSATLNDYIGKIVEEIIEMGGDIIKFAGDAILATWKCSDIGHNAKSIVKKVVTCSLAIQNECDKYMTEVGVMLYVKLAIAVGSMCLTYIGVPGCKQFDLSGSAIDDVGKTEKQATPGSIILSKLAWANCDKNFIKVTPLEDGQFFRVIRDNKSDGAACMGPVKDANFLVQDTQERLISCPMLDEFMDKVVDFRQDMPKALLPDEDDRFRNKRYIPKNIAEDKGAKENKEVQRFDRRSMTVNLSNMEVKLLRSYVPEPVLQKIDNGQDLEWLSEMRQVSVLFINMKLPDSPKQASKALQKAFEIVYEACQKYKGNVNKVFGFDKGCTFVVIFGLPGQKHEDDAVRALKCAHQIYDCLHAVSEINNESIGVTTGLAFCGVVGHKDRHEYTVIGSKVNMAARLMMFYPNIVTCDADTFEAAKSRLRKQDFVNMPYVELKGMKDPGIVREYNPCSSYKDKEMEYDYPILGREKEIKTFHSTLAEIKEGKVQRHVLTVEGDAGIGKTRLIEEFLDCADDAGFKIVFIDVDINHAKTPLYAISALMKSLLGIEPDWSHFEKERRLYEVIGDNNIKGHPSLLNDILGTQLSTSVRRMSQTLVTESQIHQKTMLIVRQVVSLVTKNQPYVIAVDSSRHIDEKSWEHIQNLLHIKGVLFLFAIRTIGPNLCPAAAAVLNDKNRVLLRIGPLPIELMSDLACQMLEVGQIPNQLHDIIQQKSQGLPSWCQQLVKDMMFSNHIQIVMKSAALQHNQPQIKVQLDDKINEWNESHPEKEAPITIHPVMALQSSVRNLLLETVQKHDERRNSSASESSGKSVSFRLTDMAKEMSKSADDKVERGRLPSNTGLQLLEEVNKFNRERKTSAHAQREKEKTGSRRNSKAVNALESKNMRYALQQEGDNLEPAFFYDEEEYFKASSKAMPFNCEEICVVTPGIKLSDVIIPNSVKDMVIARLDRMAHTEQTILKCASVLGLSFTRDVLKAIIPLNCVNMLDSILYNLSKEQVFQCASLVLQGNSPGNQKQSLMDLSGKNHNHHHHHNHTSKSVSQVLCGCYAYEGYPSINLTKTNSFPDNKKRVCLYFNFSNALVQESAYALWLEDQRKGLQEKAALYLESQPHKCHECGGAGFIAGYGKGVVADTKHRMSNFQRRSSTASRRMTAVAGQFDANKLFLNSIMNQTKEEHIKQLKQMKLPYFENYKVKGIKGESVGIALIEMAQMVAAAKDPNAEEKHHRGFLRKRSRISPGGAVSKFATQAMLAEFRRSIASSGRICLNKRKTDDDEEMGFGVMDSLSIDLSKCKCNEVMAHVLPLLVQYWKAAGNKMKTFSYLMESVSAALNMEANLNALELLDRVDRMVIAEKRNGEFYLSDEERARMRSYRGQALCNMGRLDEGIPELQAALKLLGNPFPTSKILVSGRTLKAAMIQKLHRNMTGLFTDLKTEDIELKVEQSRCLTYLTEAYLYKQEPKLAYLSCLEQLNAAEQAEDHWEEVMNAYTNTLTCCQRLGKMKMAGIYEKLAVDKSKSASFDLQTTLCVGRLHCSSLSYRLLQGDLEKAIEVGYQALKISTSLNDAAMKTNFIPQFVQALLSKNRGQPCKALLADFKKAAMSSQEHSTWIWYYACAVEIGLHIGDWVEPLKVCWQYATKHIRTTSPAIFELGLYCLGSSCILGLARKKMFKEADDLLQLLSLMQGHTQDGADLFLHKRAKVNLTEYCLLLHASLKTKDTNRQVNRQLKELRKLCKYCPLLHPRIYHLQAYFAYLKGKDARAKLLLEDCFVVSKEYGISLENEAAETSKYTWFTKTSELTGEAHEHFLPKNKL